MTVLEKRKTLTGLLVQEAMRRQVIHLPQNASIDNGINTLIKYKINAFLAKDQNGTPVGVVSKTDLSISYKHGVDSQTEAKHIMSSPVRSCSEDELLEGAIKKMIFTDVHRLFVYKNDPQNMTGVLSLSDAARIRSGSCHACLSSRIRVDERD
jgi:predicted transcriptional regulator